MRGSGVLIRAAAGNRTQESLTWVLHLVTLCRFDDKLARYALLGPFIPCERRLAIPGFPGIEGRDFRPGF